MSEKFEREERYIVFKVKDLSEHKLGWVRDVIRLNDIPTVDAVVVEADWPEYEPTWSAIERRVTGGEWNGEGLPPVGLPVEWYSDSNTGWQEIVVLAYHGDDAWIQPKGKESMIVGNIANFRPVRTPEQVAADERESAINGMLTHDALGGSRRGLAAALYDAGYRKQVAP